MVGENLDDVVGIAYLKDIVTRSYEHREGESVETVDSVMRPATFVPESKPIDELLREMQAMQTHVAIVIDEYGGTAGLVTIEDILEEIVGEIADEYDREQPPVEWLGDRRGQGHRPAARSRSSPSCSTSASRPRTWRPSADCWPSGSAGSPSPAPSRPWPDSGSPPRAWPAGATASAPCGSSASARTRARRRPARGRADGHIGRHRPRQQFRK